MLSPRTNGITRSKFVMLLLGVLGRESRTDIGMFMKPQGLFDWGITLDCDKLGYKYLWHLSQDKPFIPRRKHSHAHCLGINPKMVQGIGSANTLPQNITNLNGCPRTILLNQ